MTPKQLKEEIIMHIEEKLFEEYNSRHKENKRIFHYAYEGIETDPDALPELLTAIDRIAQSEQVTYAYRELIDFISKLDTAEEE